MAGKKEYALGIDLGTTYSCVAVWKNNKVEVIVNEQGNRITPSCVSFNNDERLIGEGAVNQALKNPTNTIFGAKRLIGRRYNEESVQSDKKVWPFRVVEGENDRPTIIVEYEGEEKCFTPEQISSMVLSKMKEYAEKFLGPESQVKKAVVTVPAYFNNSQREATKFAGTIAGLDVIHVLTEPTAAALAYGLDNKVISHGKRLVLIFDLGGGTFDVSLLDLDEHGVIEVKATAGDTHLGGEDFDNRMVDDLVKFFELKHQKSIRGNAKCMRKLKTACEKAKRILSTTTSTEISIDSFLDGEDFNRTFSRIKFEELNSDLFNKCMKCLKGCLEDAKVDKARVDEVVLVGGSTRIPKVQVMLREFFNGKNLNCSINPDEAVAYGAAIQATSLNRSQGHEKGGPDVVLLDVMPLSLGLESGGVYMSIVVPRNTRIPCEIVQDDWCTYYDNQTAVTVRVFEGERPIASDNNLLGQFRLTGLRKARKGEIKFTMTFKIDMNGILNVTAVNKDNWNKGGITITRDKLTLNKEEINSMIREAKRMEYKDQERRKALQAKHELEDYLNRIRSKLDGFTLSTGSRNIVESTINVASEWLEVHNDAPIDEYEQLKDTLRGVIAGIRCLNID